MENSEERQGRAGRSLLIRLAILALLPGLCFAQNRVSVVADAAAAAGTAYRIESLQVQVNKGIVSHETFRKEGDEDAALINRIRGKYTGQALKNFDREFQAQLKLLRNRPAAQQPKPAVPP